MKVIDIKNALDKLLGVGDQNSYQIVDETENDVFAAMQLCIDTEEDNSFNITSFLSTDGLITINFHIGLVDVNTEIYEKINEFNNKNFLFNAYLMGDNLLTIRSTGINNTTSKRVYDYVKNILDDFFGEDTYPDVLDLQRYVKHSRVN